MRFLSPSTSTTLFFVLFTTLTAEAASIWSPDGGPFQQGSSRALPARSFAARMRDAIVESIWPHPDGDHLRSHGSNRDAVAQLPENLLNKYGTDKVLRFTIENNIQRKAIAEAADTLFLDVWGFTKDWVDIRLSEDTIDTVLGLLPVNIKWQTIIHHLASAVYKSQLDEEPDQTPRLSGQSPLTTVRSPGNPSTRANLFFQKYQPLNVIVPWMRLLRSLFPTHVRLVEIGTSWEGRTINAIRIGNHPNNAVEPANPRKTIIVLGGSHAREWISTTTANYAAYELITAYGRDRQITKLIEEFDFVFVPTINPDGYAYTWEEDRLWRKNRQSTKYSFCPGVDLDRTFGFEWDGENTMGNPCSESYAGEGPFDGHEAVQFSNWISNQTETGNMDIVGFFDLHSYSQQILYPYSYTCENAPGSWENLQEIGLGLEKAIYSTNYKRYSTASACEGGNTLWPSDMNGGGSLLDWMLSVGVKYSYQIKLRDTGSYGFLLPSKEIIPTGTEFYAALKYFAQHLLDEASVEAHDESPSTQEPRLLYGLEEGGISVPGSQGIEL